MARVAAIYVGVFVFTLLRCGTHGGTRVPADEAAKAPAVSVTNEPVTAPLATKTGEVKLVDMLADPLLWGPDYPAALNAIPAFAKAGEQQVAILRRRVVGRRKSTPPEAERAASIARDALNNPPPMRIAVVPPAEVQRRKLPRIAAVVFPDDRTVRVGTPDHDAQYIAANVRIDEVEQRWGKPERVTIEVLDDGTERRPIQLTLYHYANDAIVVVTADYNSDPRVVDRVFLGTNAVLQAIF